MMRVNVQTLGILPGNTRAANDAALSAILGAGALSLYVPPGDYLFGSGHAHTGDLDIVGDGPQSAFHFEGAYGTIGLTVKGALTSLPWISTAWKNGYSVAFSSAPALSPQDIFVLHDPRAYSWSQSRPLYQKGEFCTVRDVSGSTVRLVRPLYDTYVADYTNVYKLTSRRVSIKNMTIDGAGLTGALRISLCDRPILENVRGFGAIYQIIEFDRCHMPEANNLRLQNLGTVGMFPNDPKDDYGLVITNCQGARVHEGDYYGRRHAIAIGGDSNPGAVIGRDNIVRGGVLSNDPDSGVYSADMHGNMEFCGYEGAKIFGGAGMAGRNNFLRNNYITNQQNGSCIYAGEVQGGTMVLRGNEFVTLGDPSNNGRGILDFGGGGDAIGAHTQHTLSIQIADNTLRADNSTWGTSAVYVKNNGTSCYIDISITNLMAVGDLAAMGVILRTACPSGGAYSRGIVVDNVPGFPQSAWLHLPADNAYAGVPQRLVR